MTAGSDPLVALYDAVGWAVYTAKPALLRRAIESSSYLVTVCEDDRLVALARCVSDDTTIVYVQDILVAPSHQRQGLGRLLLEDCLVRYAHVRQKVLLTDDSPEQLAFYRSLGFQRVSEGNTLNAFVRFDGA